MKICSSFLLLALSTSLGACLPPPKRPQVLDKESDHTGKGSGDGNGTKKGEGGDGTTSDHAPEGSGATDGPEGGTEGKSGEPKAGEGSMSGGDSGGGVKAPAIETSLRFDQIVWLTSHNAFVNGEDASWLVKNQSLSMQKQLDKGVTAFMLDIYFPQGANKPLLCHGQCEDVSPIKLPGSLPSVHVQMDLVEHLKTFARHLDKNKDAILTLIFEDYIDKPEVLDKALADSGLKPFIFDPYKWDVMNKGWPRIDALKKEGKRLFLISDRSEKKSLGVAYARDFTNENYWSLGPKGEDVKCVTRWDKVPLNRRSDKFEYLFVMNHFRDIPSSSLSRSDNTLQNLWKRLNENCLPAAERRPNFLAVDHFDEADWGAKKIVDELRDFGITIYKDAKLQGPMKMLKEGRYTAKDFGFGDNEIDSIRVDAGFRVKIYEDAAFKNLLGEYTNDVRDLGDKINKTSSLVIERK